MSDILSLTGLTLYHETASLTIFCQSAIFKWGFEENSEGLIDDQANRVITLASSPHFAKVSAQRHQEIIG